MKSINTTRVRKSKVAMRPNVDPADLRKRKRGRKLQSDEVPEQDTQLSQFAYVTEEER